MGKDLFDIFAKRRIESAIKKKTQRQRCGNPDIGQAEFGKSPNSGKKSYVKRYVAQTPWGKSNLTYKIAQFGQDLSQTVQRQEFQKAFKMWTDAAPGLDVREAQGNEIPDISIE